MMAEGFFFDEAEFQPTNKPQRRPVQTAVGCEGCGLFKKSITPRMPPSGLGGMRIVVVGEAPGEEEDKAGHPFVAKGRSGQFLRHSLARFGVDLDKDCVTINALSCRPTDADGRNREPTEAELRACRPRVDAAIKAARPDLILALGSPAIGAVLSDAPPGIAVNATTMHGRIIPNRKHDCWVACTFHPSWYCREEGRHDGRMTTVLAEAMETLADFPTLPPLLDESAFEIVEDVGQVEQLLRRLGDGTAEVSMDFEATGLDPWEPSFKLLTMAVTDTPDQGWCIPMYHPHAQWGDASAAVWDLLWWFVQDSPCPKVIQNWQYEEIVSRVYMGLVGVRNVVCDTMLREHVLDNRRGVCSQKFQEYVRYGVTGHKGSVNVGRLKNEWLDDVARYNVLDARYALRWKRDQDAEMTPRLAEAYRLFHEATPVLCSMTQRGIQLDLTKLNVIKAEVDADLTSLRDAERNAGCLKLFRAKYGHAWDASSPSDRKKLFFGVLGLEALRATESQEGVPDWRDDPDSCGGDLAAWEHCLEQVAEGSEEQRLLRAVMSRSKLEKLSHTYVKGLREQVRADGLLHPQFPLHKVHTYRGSSSDPNFQNFPKRDKEMARVRRAMTPQNDVFLEADYSGAEVRTLACRTLDPLLVANVTNGVDFHRHYAAFLYEIEEDQIDKDQRFLGKNGFVFPEFYGSRAKSISRKTSWRLERIQAAEKKLWTDMPDVEQWQHESEQAYYRDGYLELMTGFVVRFGDAGVLSRFQICNWPIQGPAFHRLLRAMVDVEGEMRRRGLKSYLVGQIHDSLVTDCVLAEVEEVIDLQQAIMRRSAWDWCRAVPWEAEFSVGPNLIDLEAI